jgi:hypothetical protein
MESPNKLRHRCRNPHCRSKLKAPVENEHHAFCSKTCHAVFYRNRCQVCEEPIQRKTERQTTCFSHKCKSERRRFPAAYSWPEYKTNETGGFEGSNDERRATLAKTSLAPPEVPILRGLKQPSFGTDRPVHRCLRNWSWSGDGLADHSLYDTDGLTIARIVLDGDRYVLRCPNVWPRQSWPDLERARRGAEAFALTNLPLDHATAARVARDNGKPHPMAASTAGQSFGARQGLDQIEDAPALVPDITVETEEDELNIPEFLRRVTPILIKVLVPLPG